MSSTQYAEWLELSQQLKSIKARELKARNAIIESYPTKKLEGSSTMVEDDFKVNVTFKLTRSVDRTVLEQIWDDLSPEEQEAIEWKPSIVLSKYRALEESGSKLLDAVTVKPAQASLAIDWLGEVE